MHYLCLLDGTKKFARHEGSSKLYDYYMAEKNWATWDNSPNLPIRETMLLFWFILSWDRNFQGDVERFQEIYREIFPIIRPLRAEKIESANLNYVMKQDLLSVFDKIAKCTKANRFESTDASKILHTILPGLAVMWDEKIRIEVLGKDRKKGRDYAFDFLPKMQEEIREALDTYVIDHAVSRENASKAISVACNSHSLAKVLDEYNYAKFTLGLNILVT